jgi:hypothetical protein
MHGASHWEIFLMRSCFMFIENEAMSVTNVSDETWLWNLSAINRLFCHSLSLLKVLPSAMVYSTDQQLKSRHRDEIKSQKIGDFFPNN